MSTLWLASYILLWIITLCLVLVILVIARQIGLMHRRLRPAPARIENAGPEIGTKIPEAIAQDINGRQVNLAGYSEKMKMLIFISAGCPTCQELMSAVKSIRKSEKKYLEIYIVSLSVDEKRNVDFIRSNGLENITYIVGNELGKKYNIASPPYAVLVGTDNVVITKGVVNHLDHLESMLHTQRPESDGMTDKSSEKFLLGEVS